MACALLRHLSLAYALRNIALPNIATPLHTGSSKTSLCYCSASLCNTLAKRYHAGPRHCRRCALLSSVWPCQCSAVPNNAVPLLCLTRHCFARALRSATLPTHSLAKLCITLRHLCFATYDRALPLPHNTILSNARATLYSTTPCQCGALQRSAWPLLYTTAHNHAPHCHAAAVLSWTHPCFA